MTVADVPAPAEPLSAVLIRLAASEGEQLSIAQLIGALDDRSLGSVMLVLALPATLSPPFAAACFGAPLFVISAQLLFRRTRPWLPAALGDLSLKRGPANRLLRRAAATLARLEVALKPRLAPLLHPWHIQATASGCMALSVVLMLPAPLAHTAAGLGVGAFAAGLVQRDGVALLAGWLLTLGCALLMALLTGGVLIGLGRL